MRTVAATALLLFGLAAPSRAHHSSLDTIFAYRAPSHGWKDGFYGELSYWARTNGPLSFGGGAGVTKSDVKTPRVFDGSILMVPVMLKARVAFPKATLGPFFEGGFGYFFFDHHLSESAQRSCDQQGFACKQEIENTFGGTLGGGLSVRFAENASLSLSVVSFFVDPVATATKISRRTGASSVSRREISLDSLLIAIRTSVRF